VIPEGKIISLFRRNNEMSESDRKAGCTDKRQEQPETFMRAAVSAPLKSIPLREIMQ
jgi:hypothetical protein